MEQSGDLPSEKMKKSVEVLLRQVEILNQIASSFSSFATMPATSPQPVDAFDLVRNTIALFDAQRDGEVTFKAEGNSPKVLVDAKSFSRALSNIIINALQARTDEQGKAIVSVEVKQAEGNVLVLIKDNGRGMTPEVKEMIFQPQFTTKHSGSGLGLALTRQIVTQAGGKIWFESVEGVGSTFFIELPAITP